jgi:hypothetical protein
MMLVLLVVESSEEGLGEGVRTVIFKYQIVAE